MEYKVLGAPLPVVEVTLQPNEVMISDSGAMAWMDPCIKMETTTNGGAGKALGRLFSGETMFLNRYTAQQKGLIAYASSFPGEIKAIEMVPGKDIIVQKSSFLASSDTVNREVYFSKKLGSGLFGGEGFIMNRFFGSGMLFLEIDGSTVEYDLAAGQQIIVDTGYLAMMDATCKMDIQTVPGLKNKLLGGEGLFNTVITGPGRVVLQTMPISSVAGSIIPYIPTSNK